MPREPDLENFAPGWIEHILSFWFGLSRDDWFAKSPRLDQECAKRFAHLHPLIDASTARDAAASPRSALAAVIMLDQVSRNIFRDTPRAFASDGNARAIAALALDRGYDARLRADEKLFLYLPFEHSEHLVDQDRSVALFRALDDKQYLDYALAHRDIIARFGRFPHRNAVLGRASSPEELEFLTQPGSSF